MNKMAKVVNGTSIAVALILVSPFILGLVAVSFVTYNLFPHMHDWKRNGFDRSKGECCFTENCTVCGRLSYTNEDKTKRVIV
jgi:hypothetical protein